jgi:hypothetical protein
MSGPKIWFSNLWRRTVVVPVLVRLARRDLERGELVRAKQRFLRCAHLVPFSFQAHFGLACLYLREHDYARARRELMLAREIAPARYLASQARLPEPMGRPDAARLTSRQGAVSQSASAASALAEDRWNGVEPPYPGDFADHDEWERFRRMGSFRAAETVAVDWDQVAKALLDGPS